MALDLENLRVTSHAAAKLRERAVPTAALMRTLRHPCVVEPSRRGQRRFVGDHGLVAVVAGGDAEPVLVTVLLRESTRWTSEQAATRFNPTEETTT